MADMTPEQHAERATWLLTAQTLINGVTGEPYICGRESVPAILAAVGHAVLALRGAPPAQRMPDGEQALGRLADELAGVRASRAEALEDVERITQERDEALALLDGARLEIVALKLGGSPSLAPERAQWERVLAAAWRDADLWRRRACAHGWQPTDTDPDPDAPIPYDVPAPRDGDATDGGAP